MSSVKTKLRRRASQLLFAPARTHRELSAVKENSPDGRDMCVTEEQYKNKINLLPRSQLFITSNGDNKLITVEMKRNCPLFFHSL